MKIYKKYAKTLPYKNKRRKEAQNNNSTQLPSDAKHRDVFPAIDENFELLSRILGQSIGLVQAKYDILEGNAQVGIAYITSISDIQLITNQIIEPLLNSKTDFRTGFFNNLLTVIQSKIITIPDRTQSNEMKQVITALLNGDTVLFFDGVSAALIIASRKVETRAIEKPDNEVTVFAAMESFNENLETNCSLIIKRLPIPALHFKTYTIGKISKTKIKLLWLEDTANEELVEEAKRRIQQIDVNYIDGIGTLAELIQDNPISIFPKYKQTQRPDVTARSLTEGRIAILCNNSPFALIAPITFWDNFRTMDDYNETPIVSSYFRLVRILAFVLSIQIAPIYLAFVSYNHAIVPPTLALNIASGREGVPFPSVLELLVLIMSITIIREASLRISGSVGFFIGTLSAVVIGQASVSAGYVSASVIIVAAISAISSFAISSTTLVFPARLINYSLILLASLFGMFGVINGMILIMWHLSALDSFGVPYLYPVIPFDFKILKDYVIRAPLSNLKQPLKLFAPFIKIKQRLEGDN